MNEPTPPPITEIDKLKPIPARTHERQRPKYRGEGSRNMLEQAAEDIRTGIEGKYGIEIPVRSMAKRAVEAYQEAYAHDSPTIGYEYHNEFHTLAKAEASQAVIQSLQENPTDDPLGFQDHLRQEYEIDDLEMVKQVVYLVDMWHDICDIGVIKADEAGQPKVDYHTDTNNNFIHRSGKVQLEGDDTTQYNIEELVVAQMELLIDNAFPELNDDDREKYTRLAKDLARFTVVNFGASENMNPLEKFVQLTDQVGQARYNKEDPEVGILGLMHEWEAEGKLENLNLTPEQMLLFSKHRFNAILGDDQTAKDFFNKVWKQPEAKDNDALQDLYDQFNDEDRRDLVAYRDYLERKFSDTQTATEAA